MKLTQAMEFTRLFFQAVDLSGSNTLSTPVFVICGIHRVPEPANPGVHSVAKGSTISQSEARLCNPCSPRYHMHKESKVASRAAIYVFTLFVQLDG